MYQSLLLVPFILFLSACSSLWSSSPQQTISPEKISGLEVFMSRSSLQKVEFEHFKISKDSMFIECGTIGQGRWYPRMQEVVRLDNDTQQNLSSLLGTVVGKLDSEDLSLEDPGDNKGFFDPGIYELQLKNREKPIHLRTSQKSIAEPSREIERNLQKMSRILRKEYGDSLCGNGQFFGL